VLVIDDGSSDDTVLLAKEAGATVIEHEENGGYGAALRTAFREANRRRADHLVILDGDGQHDPSDIPGAVDVQGDGADIVIGSRFAEGSETELPLYRRFGLAVVNALTNLSMGVLVRSKSRVGDTQSGFRTYNREAIESLSEDPSIGSGMSARARTSCTTPISTVMNLRKSGRRSIMMWRTRVRTTRFARDFAGREYSQDG